MECRERMRDSKFREWVSDEEKVLCLSVGLLVRMESERGCAPSSCKYEEKKRKQGKTILAHFGIKGKGNL